MSIFLPQVGLISGILMPFFNIPLIWHIVRRRSSLDISLFWVIGVEVCVLGMLPSAWRSTDFVLKSFGVVNTLFFTVVCVVVLYFHPAVRKRATPAK